MEQQKTELDNWRSDVTESKDQLKIKDGETKVITFADEGKKNVHPDFGTSIVFNVLVENDKEPKTFYVKSNNFSLLKQIKELGTLTGTKAKIVRVGSTKSNTRYTLVKV